MAYRGTTENGTSTEEMLDSQNRRGAEQLSQKISQLKGCAHEIEIETKENNKLLDEMDTDFDSSKSLLSGSLNRVHKMMNTGRRNRKVMCYISLFLVGFFIVVYYLVTKIGR